jgi:hypothetical protein
MTSLSHLTFSLTDSLLKRLFDHVSRWLWIQYYKYSKDVAYPLHNGKLRFKSHLNHLPLPVHLPSYIQILLI